jgi:hypothetical protein
MAADKKIQKQRKHKEFLSFTDAVQILGFGTHNRIAQLVKNGKLQAYKLPLTPKLRVLKKDVESLVTPEKNGQP